MMKALWHALAFSSVFFTTVDLDIQRKQILSGEKCENISSSDPSVRRRKPCRKLKKDGLLGQWNRKSCGYPPGHCFQWCCLIVRCLKFNKSNLDDCYDNLQICNPRNFTMTSGKRAWGIYIRPEFISDPNCSGVRPENISFKAFQDREQHFVSQLFPMNAKYFANRNEGKNETKQKRETKTKLISKKNINKQHTAYLPPVPHLSREGKRIRRKRQRNLDFYRNLDPKRKEDFLAAFSFRKNLTSSSTKCGAMFSTLALGDFLRRHIQAHLNTTATNISFSSEVADVFASRPYQDRGKKFRFADPKNENFVEISYRNAEGNGSMVIGVMYKNLTELFTSDKNTRGTNKTRVLNSIIMSVEIYPEPADVLWENITLVFKHIKAGGKSRECVFWDMFGDGPVGWSAQGCLTRIMSESQTECKCNHLTHFAVLMDITEIKDESNARDTKENDKILTVLTHVGMALSLAGVSITIISYIRLTDRQAPLFHSRVGLTSCIGAGHIVFFVGIDATENKAACVTIAALMQYFLMAAFCWMLVEGAYIYLFVIKVHNVNDKICRFHGLCWGLPAVMVTTSLGVVAGKDGIENYVSDQYCWISSRNKVIWIFVSFVGLIEIINMAILARVIKEITTIQHVKDNQSEQIRVGVRAFLVLAPLLGVTWLIGFLSPLHIAFSYMFVILNSTQGFSIFFFHCFRNNEIRERFKRRLRQAQN